MAVVLVFAGLALAGIVFLLGIVGLALRLVFRLIFFPLFLVKWIVGGLLMLVMAPVLAVLAIVFSLVFAVFTVVFGIVFSIPLLPLLAIGAILWMLLVKSNRSPAAV